MIVTSSRRIVIRGFLTCYCLTNFLATVFARFSRSTEWTRINEIFFIGPRVRGLLKTQIWNPLVWESDNRASQTCPILRFPNSTYLQGEQLVDFPNQSSASNYSIGIIRDQKIQCPLRYPNFLTHRPSISPSRYPQTGDITGFWRFAPLNNPELKKVVGVWPGTFVILFGY